MKKFKCTVRMPGSYTDSVAKAKQVQPGISKSGAKAMSYVMNLRQPQVPKFNLFDGTFFFKMMEWMGATLKYSLIHASVDKAKETLTKGENVGLSMESYLRTDGVAELLTHAATVPVEGYEMDFGTAALAGAAWYLKANVRCVSRKPTPMGESAKFVKYGDNLFKLVVERSNLSKRDILRIKCRGGSIWDRLPLAIVSWAYGQAHPYCGRRTGGGGSGKKDDPFGSNPAETG